MASPLDSATRRIIKEKIKKALTRGERQRDIANDLKLSLPTVNKICKEIASEIEKGQALEKQRKARRKKSPIAIKKVKADVEQYAKEEATILTPEQLQAKQAEMKQNAMFLFNGYMLELKSRMPEMTIEELQKGLMEMWGKVNE